jgi:hypothetical protein
MKNISYEIKTLLGLGCIMVVLVLAVAFGVLSAISWLLLVIWKAVAVAKFAAPSLSYWNMFGIVTAIWFIGNLFFGNNKSKSK